MLSESAARACSYHARARGKSFICWLAKPTLTIALLDAGKSRAIACNHKKPSRVRPLSSSVRPTTSKPPSLAAIELESLTKAARMCETAESIPMLSIRAMVLRV